MRTLLLLIVFTFVSSPSAYSQVDDGTGTAQLLTSGDLSSMSHLIGAVLIPDAQAAELRRTRALPGRDAFFNGLRSWKAAGNDPMEYLENAFGPYVNRAVALYAEKGQIITFDPALNSLDKAVAIHSMSQRNDVPNLKRDFSRFNDGEKGDTVRTHFYLDKSHLDRMKASLSDEAFETIYGNSDERVPNPILIDTEIASAEDLEALIEEYGSDSYFMNEEVPALREEVAALREGDKPITYRLSTFDHDAPIAFTKSNAVVVEFDMDNADLFFRDFNGNQRKIGQRVGDRMLGSSIIPNIGELSNDQIDYGHRFNIGISDALAWQSRLVDSNGNNNHTQVVEQMINSARQEVYVICGDK